MLKAIFATLTLSVLSTTAFAGTISVSDRQAQKLANACAEHHFQVNHDEVTAKGEVISADKWGKYGEILLTVTATTDGGLFSQQDTFECLVVVDNRKVSYHTYH